MSDTPWTRGPWIIWDGDLVCADDPSNPIATLYDDTSKADANLIAAAPDLYAALDAIIDGRFWSMSDDKFGAAKAALAKARGQA